ncbi:pyridoxamine 5'-phosphate oxidase-domain-containing protein [Lasiosphaeria hispida]|uniref:Pyridoxamine 5'-phosphate oxidase-domain-containing protein n=1 Tax=Lasiosphaeria hispida TaxID=260671 RepID=A0AAJ0HH76_9PEZI|nr:pyridoxamine 5'-phosphate oxidase-domain-containing protein [Lasiosphaeria hispida]
MATNPPSTPAPWRDAFVKHITAMPSPTFVLSTLHANPDSASPFPTLPRARTCVFRGMWATLPDNERNPAPRNPAVFDSDLPTFTTDVRMEKAGEIIGTAPGGGTGASDIRGTGGGGPVEAIYWAAEHGTQWRVRGTAWVLGPDVDGDRDGAARAKGVLRGRMRRTGDAAGGRGLGGEEGEKKEGWSWSREVTGAFGNMSPIMRGTFRNPSPGSPLIIPVPPETGLGLGQMVEDLEDPVARANFRVVVIVPTEVDQVDLSDAKQPKRWLHVYRGASYKSTQPGGEVIGEWETVELWP